MIKCNVTVCGVIGRDASIRTNKEGKTFLVFPLRVMIPDTDGKTMPIEVDVSKDTARKEVSNYRNGSRIEVSGTMYLKHRGDKLYFNLLLTKFVQLRQMRRIRSRANWYFEVRSGSISRKKGIRKTSLTQCFRHSVRRK